MKAELEHKLAEEFPFMRRGKNAEEQRRETGRIGNLYDAYGCDIGNGWYELLRGLCREITEAYEQVGKPVDILMDQVKEKWGGLRFYYHFQGEEPGIHAIDPLGGPGLRFTPSDTELHRRIGEIVARGEAESETVCEFCGKPGETRTDLRWVRTLCEGCYRKAVERGMRRAERKKEEYE